MKFIVCLFPCRSVTLEGAGRVEQEIIRAVLIYWACRAVPAGREGVALGGARGALGEREDRHAQLKTFAGLWARGVLSSLLGVVGWVLCFLSRRGSLGERPESQVKVEAHGSS